MDTVIMITVKNKLSKLRIDLRRLTAIKESAEIEAWKIHTLTGLKPVPLRLGATELRSHMFGARQILVGSLFPVKKSDQK